MRSRSNASASSWARRLARRAAGFLVLLLVLGAAGAAQAAKKKIVILGFTGPKASRAQRGVVKLLKPSVTIVTGKAFVKAARSVEGYKPDAEGVAKVARGLHAHGIVTGKVSKRGSKYKLTLQILEGRSGEAVGDGITIPLKRGRLNTAAKRKLKRELKAILSELPDPNSEEPAGDELVASASDGADEEAAAGEGLAGEKSPASEEVEEKPEPPARPRAREPRKRVASAEEVRSEPEPGRGEDQDGSLSAASKQADRDARGRAIDAAAGVSFVSRKLTFSFVDGLQDQPQGYSGGLVPGIFAAAEIYPVALADRQGSGFARNIGITLMVDKVLVIKSELQGAGNQSLPTAQTRYGGGLIYRWNFGSTPTSPTLKVSAGYNVLSFSIDESAAEDPSVIEIPDVSYSYVDPGLGFRLPLGERLAALAEAHYLYVIDAGQMQDADRYGSASVIAFDADVGAEFKVTSNILARAGARFMQVGMTFDGNGELTERTDDGMQDVTSAKDRYLGFYATAGLLF